jgi:hypothetical protein
MTARIAFALLFCTSCTLFQPTPRVVERNYEDDSVTKRVKVGRDLNVWPPLQETQEHARARLIADISRECPKYKLLSEGTETQDREVIGSHYNSVHKAYETDSMTATDVYLWIRYRCDGSPSVPTYRAPTSLPSPEEAKARAFQAMSQKCGEDYARGIEAAGQLQEARLRTAGFSSETETKVATNLLTDAPMTEQSRLYLSALGLSEQGERQARGDFLRMLKASPTDLRTVDEFTLQTTSMFYGAYLKQFQQVTGSGLVCRQP